MFKMSLTKEKKKIKLVTLPEVKEYLEKLDEETSDQIQRRTLDYVLKFAQTSKKEAQNIRKRLIKETKLTEKEAVELSNIMPESKEELYVFTSGWKKLLPEEISLKILEIIKDAKSKDP
jgi:DNA-directed RNA polymerase subunit F|tara:strand:- start:1504 stop:1860 length:357 start_codon:yes stop_codon:yes gene_type:complete